MSDIIAGKAARPSSSEPTPTGIQLAVCIGVVPLGMQVCPFGGREKLLPKVAVVWELEHRSSRGYRFIVSRIYTHSLNRRANLRKDLEAWRSRPFDPQRLEVFELANVVGAVCNLHLSERISSSGHRYANVERIAPRLPGQAKIKPERIGHVPAWISKIIQESTVREVVA